MGIALVEYGPFHRVMESREQELLEGIVNQLIDEEALGVCFEMHRAIKLGYYELLYPDDSVYEKQDIVDVRGLDIFGNSPMVTKKVVDCVCPNCNRTLGASKFAPHLEKCMGMGRKSTRIENRKHKPTVDSDQDGSEDNEEEWTYPAERRGSKKPKKERPANGSPWKPKPGRPPKRDKEKAEREAEQGASDSFFNLKPSLQQHNVASFSTLPTDYKQALLQQICGVVSERTGRLCTRSINCPQHSEGQRQEVRRQLCHDHRSPDEAPSVERKGRKERERQQESAEDVDVDVTFDPSPSPHMDGPVIKVRKKKMKSKSSRKHGSSVAMGTIMHSNSSMM